MWAHVLCLIEKLEYTPLLPAPNIAEGDAMYEVLSKVNYIEDDLMDLPMKVVYEYRGSLLYLENGDIIYRYQKKSSGAEECYIQYKGDWCDGIVDFIM